MRKTDAFRRAAALMAALSITVSLAAPAFAGTYYIDYGDITITKMDDGSQKIEQNGAQVGMDAAGDETIITTRDQTPATQESDLEGPAAEDSGFGPVVEDNYQPTQPEDAEEPEGTDQPEDAEEPKAADRQESAEEQESAGQQPQPQQAAPAAAPAAPTSVNGKENGFWGNTITVINNFANTVLNLTLKDVKIDVSDTGDVNHYGPDQRGKAALSVQGSGDVEIELDGKNELKSGAHRAGLDKNTFDSTGTLTLKDDNKEAGSLKATGGVNGGAGIGGSYEEGTKNITITGGTVNAAGDWGGAGIGGGEGGNGEDITITGGTVTAAGGDYGAGIGGGGGGGFYGNGEDITITGGTVTASGCAGAGIGGGVNGSGSNVTVSGAAQVTVTASKSSDWNSADTGATIGNGGSVTEDGDLVDGKEIQADISGLTTGYIHHIIYDENGKKVKEWWEYGHLQPAPDTPNAPAEETNEVSLGTPVLHVETLEGDPLPFDARQQGGTLRVTTDNLAARLHGTRQALEALQEQGVEQIVFVTTLKTTTLSVAELLAEGGSWFALEHDGLVSRRLSAAQAESLKCRMR